MIESRKKRFLCFWRKRFLYEFLFIPVRLCYNKLIHCDSQYGLPYTDTDKLGVRRMQLPFISVILPVRNEEKFIAACVDSIFSQD